MKAAPMDKITATIIVAYDEAVNNSGGGMTVSELLEFIETVRNMSDDMLDEYVLRCRAMAGLEEIADALERWGAARKAERAATGET